MAEKRVWLGSVGPYLYEDTDQYNPNPDDPDSIEDLTSLYGIRTEGQIKVETAPTTDDEGVRYQDIVDDTLVVPVRKLATLSDFDTTQSPGLFDLFEATDNDYIPTMVMIRATLINAVSANPVLGLKIGSDFILPAFPINGLTATNRVLIRPLQAVVRAIEMTEIVQVDLVTAATATDLLVDIILFGFRNV